MQNQCNARFFLASVVIVACHLASCSGEDATETLDTDNGEFNWTFSGPETITMEDTIAQLQEAYPGTYFRALTCVKYPSITSFSIGDTLGPSVKILDYTGPGTYQSTHAEGEPAPLLVIVFARTTTDGYQHQYVNQPIRTHPYSGPEGYCEAVIESDDDSVIVGSVSCTDLLLERTERNGEPVDVSEANASFSGQFNCELY